MRGLGDKQNWGTLCEKSYRINKAILFYKKECCIKIHLETESVATAISNVCSETLAHLSNTQQW